MNASSAVTEIHPRELLNAEQVQKDQATEEHCRRDEGGMSDTEELYGSQRRRRI